MYKILVKHSKDCCMNRPANRQYHTTPWSGVVDEARPHVFLTKSGNNGKGMRPGRPIWTVYTCNDTQCPGRIAVRADDIMEKAPSGFRNW
jgi:hypothetical protein